MDGWLKDVRLGLRVLVRRPGFSVVALLCLGLGIGPTTALFSLLNAFLFRSLPYPDADRLMMIGRETRAGSGAGPFTFEEAADLEKTATSFEHLVARTFLPVTLRHTTTEKVQSELVSAEYFSMLGIGMAEGRAFRPAEDDRLGGEPVAVLSHRLWRRSFGSDPATIGSTVRVNGQLVTVVGVAAEGFTGIVPMVAADLWLPVGMQVPLAAADTTEGRDLRWLGLVGKLRPGLSKTTAAAELTAVYRLEPTNDVDGAEIIVRVEPFQGVGVPTAARGQTLQATTVALVLVIFALVIAFSNYANLLLARAAARVGEIGVRLALGAGRLRLLRQLLIESLLLSLGGGLVGFVLAVGLVRLFYLALPRTAGYIRYTLDVSPDFSVFVATLMLAIVVGVLFGLAPALHATRTDVMMAVHGQGAAAATGRDRSGRLRTVLVAGQIALCLVLLVATGLLVRTLERSLRIDPGFRPEGVLAARLSLDTDRYDAASALELTRQLAEKVEALPAVAEVAFADQLPFDNRLPRVALGIDDRELDQVGVVRSSPGHFDLLRASLVSGRSFRASDTDSAPSVTLVNRSLSAVIAPGGNPVGKRIKIEEGDEVVDLEIVGVVDDVRYTFSTSTVERILYRPLAQSYSSRLNVLVRVAGDPWLLGGPLREAVHELDPNLALSDVLTLEEQVDSALLSQRSVATLFGAVAGLSLVLALIGLYGVMSYSVQLRRREIGVRMALGARRRDVMGMILSNGMRIAILGMIAGLILAYLGTRVLRRLLYGLNPTDPLTFSLVVFALAASVALACAVPAWRAAHQDAMASLREE